MISRTAARYIFIVFLICLSVFRLSHVTGIHGWSDDGSAYLRHTLNLLAGVPYARIDYEAAASSPPTNIYPPGLPIVLYPLVKLWGLNFLWLQRAMVVLSIISLSAVFWAIEPWGPGIALLTGIVMGVRPELGTLAEHVNSDYLFLLTLACIVKCADSQHFWRNDGKSWILAGALSCLLTASIEIRSAGFILVPAILVYALWREKRIRPAILAAIGASVVVTLGIEMLLRDSSIQVYGKHFLDVTNIGSVRRNLIQYSLYVGSLAGLTDLRFIGAVVASALAWWGGIDFARHRCSLWIIFAILYLPLLVLWPYSDPERFFLPVTPVAVAGILQSLRNVTSRVPKPIRTVLMCAAFFGIAGPAAVASWREPPRTTGLNDGDSKDLYEAIQRLTPETSVIMFRKARTLALFTRRHSVSYGFVVLDRMRADFCAARAEYLVFAPSIFPDDVHYLESFAKSRNFQVIYENRSFQLLKAQNACGPR